MGGIKMERSNKFYTFIVYAILTFVSIITVGPFYLMIVMSTYNSNDLFSGLHLLPGSNFLINLKDVFENAGFGIYYFNSIYIAIFTTILTVFVCAMCGYALAKFSFKLNKIAYYTILFTMMLPSQLGLIAFVWEMNKIGWTDTHLSLIIPAAANAFAVYWMRQYIVQGVPNEILESGRMDGCNEFGVFFKLVIPFIKPALGSQAMLSFMASWNSYLLPLVLISKQKRYTVTLGLSTLDALYRMNYGARIMALVIGTIPMFILFLIFSKSLITGITAGSVKG
jgi:ABC-type glycerol-3-phosphate transport system permease component